MKALVIVGSPKENGSTSLLADKIIEGMHREGITIVRFNRLILFNFNKLDGFERNVFILPIIKVEDAVMEAKIAHIRQRFMGLVF